MPGQPLEVVTAYLMGPDRMMYDDVVVAFVDAATNDVDGLNRILDDPTIENALGALQQAVRGCWRSWRSAEPLYPFISPRAKRDRPSLDYWELCDRLQDVGVKLDARSLDRISELIKLMKVPAGKKLTLGDKQANDLHQFFKTVAIALELKKADEGIPAAFLRFAMVFGSVRIAPEKHEDVLSILVAYASLHHDANAMRACLELLPEAVTNDRLALNVACHFASESNETETLRWVNEALRLGVTAQRLGLQSELAEMLKKPAFQAALGQPKS